jgi:uncharacterized membrane protein
MAPIAVEWLNLILRWAHVLAGILWIGDSFLFMWMDKSLVQPTRPRPGAVVGELWMVHSGGFYEVVKRKSLAGRGAAHRPLSGLGGIHHVDRFGIFLLASSTTWAAAWAAWDSTAPLGTGWALLRSLGLFIASWRVYDMLAIPPLAGRPAPRDGVLVPKDVGAAYGLTRACSGRAAFLHLGAMLGTIMAANVWRVIIPGRTECC